MELNALSVQLGVLSHADIKEISQIAPSYQCYFLWKNFQNPSENCQQKVLLQLRGDYVLQIQPTNRSIISGFKCDYDVNFEIIRTQSQTPLKIGQPQTLEFIFVAESRRTVSLIVQNAQKLQNFAQKLQKKYLVQLGFREGFKAVKVLGKGVTATVYKAIRHRDQKDVAIKSFKRSVYFATENGKPSFQKQFKILTLLYHPNICQLEGVYETDNSTYIVMEHLEISLLGWIQKYGFPTYENARKMMFQMLRGIQYLHSKGIMHRDLKLQNIMVRKDSKQNIEVVIVDLGLAQFVGSQKFLYTRCGTPGYVAPQILKTKSGDSQKYNQQCDIFSLGVIFHILFFKKSIFEGNEVKEVIKKNTQCNIDFNAEYLSNISVEGLDLLKKMLQKDPSKRISSSDALSHQFIKSCSASSSLGSELNFAPITLSINNIA